MDSLIQGRPGLLRRVGCSGLELDRALGLRFGSRGQDRWGLRRRNGRHGLAGRMGQVNRLHWRGASDTSKWVHARAVRGNGNPKVVDAITRDGGVGAKGYTGFRKGSRIILGARWNGLREAEANRRTLCGA